eukprot:CAMPEP_0116822496 /NCGR_PEP_ID=MMETSP0418-20121206/301_1 /TAXON_ID=1158023 /ORGANISM="Astrosyne radiata, Strain 13vi08-1A" /LENGTH=135 /DNA_ID=CAMNT_0004450617 /DNA_START=20 /DNA_END=427 /DNA_ORIENTATION=+
MKSFRPILLCLLFASAWAWVPLPSKHVLSSSRKALLPEKWEIHETPSLPKQLAAGSLVAAFWAPLIALADDVETVDLPPPWIIGCFGILVFGGIGASGMMMKEAVDGEAALPNMSGIKARKAQERATSSFFKKKE